MATLRKGPKQSALIPPPARSDLSAMSEKDILRRLEARYPTAAATAVEMTSPAVTEPDIALVRERKNEIIARAQKATGVSSEDVAIILAVQASAVPVGGGAEGNPEKGRELVSIAVETLGQIKPEGMLQSMLAVQMIGVHNSAVKFLMRASDAQTEESADANVLRATRLMRLFNDQLEALAKLKGKTSEQKVTVEHFHVHEGGQAIVGAVTRVEEPVREGGPN